MKTRNYLLYSVITIFILGLCACSNESDYTSKDDENRRNEQVLTKLYESLKINDTLAVKAILLDTSIPNDPTTIRSSGSNKYLDKYIKTDESTGLQYLEAVDFDEIIHDSSFSLADRKITIILLYSLDTMRKDIESRLNKHSSRASDNICSMQYEYELSWINSYFASKYHYAWQSCFRDVDVNDSFAVWGAEMCVARTMEGSEGECNMMIYEAGERYNECVRTSVPIQ